MPYGDNLVDRRPSSDGLAMSAGLCSTDVVLLIRPPATRHARELGHLTGIGLPKRPPKNVSKFSKVLRIEFCRGLHRKIGLAEFASRVCKLRAYRVASHSRRSAAQLE